MSFPSEILHAILREVTDFNGLEIVFRPQESPTLAQLRRLNYGSLITTCVVCKAWLDPSLRVLYSRLLITDWSQIPALATVLASSRDRSKDGHGYAVWARSFYLEVAQPWATPEDEPHMHENNLETILSLCFNIKEAAYFQYNSSMGARPRSLPRPVPPLSAISARCTQLAISEDPWRSRSTLLKILSSFSQLRSLDLYFHEPLYIEDTDDDEDDVDGGEDGIPPQERFGQLSNRPYDVHLPNLHTLRCRFILSYDTTDMLKMVADRFHLPSLENLEVHFFQGEDELEDEIMDQLKYLLRKHGSQPRFFLFNVDLDDWEFEGGPSLAIPDALASLPNVEHLVLRMATCDPRTTKIPHRKLQRVDYMFPAFLEDEFGDRSALQDTEQLCRHLLCWKDKQLFPALKIIRVGDARFSADYRANIDHWEDIDTEPQEVKKAARQLLRKGIHLEDWDGNSVDVNNIDRFNLTLRDLY